MGFRCQEQAAATTRKAFEVVFNEAMQDDNNLQLDNLVLERLRLVYCVFNKCSFTEIKRVFGSAINKLEQFYSFLQLMAPTECRRLVWMKMQRPLFIASIHAICLIDPPEQLGYWTRDGTYNVKLGSNNDNKPNPKTSRNRQRGCSIPRCKHKST